MRGLPMQYVRHTILSEDVWAEKKEYWLYFIGKLFELSRKDDFDFEHLIAEADIEENDLQTCKSFHSNLRDLVDDNLHEMLVAARRSLEKPWIEIYSWMAGLNWNL